MLRHSSQKRNKLDARQHSRKNKLDNLLITPIKRMHAGPHTQEERRWTDNEHTHTHYYEFSKEEEEEEE
jgi:hypothetical protein